MTNVTTLQTKQEIKKVWRHLYNAATCSLGLASLEVDVLTNSANENLWNLYGYEKMTGPHFSIQTQVQNQQDVISSGLVQVARVRC